MQSTLFSSLALPLLFVSVLLGAAQDKPARPAPDKAPAAQADPNAGLIAFQKPCYPLKTCVISGEELGPKAVDAVIDGRLVRLCCNNCVEAVNKDKAAAFAKLDKAVIEQQKAAYPLEKCPISGEKLGDKAVDMVQGTRLVRVCCNDCVAEVKKNPDAAMKKLNDGYIAAQKASYPLTTCVVTGEEIGKDPGMEPVDFLYGTRYFRLCCGGCKKAIAKDPEGMWAKVEAARAAKKAEKKG